MQLAERETTELREALEGLDHRHKNLNQELEQTGQVHYPGFLAMLTQCCLSLKC